MRIAFLAACLVVSGCLSPLNFDFQFCPFIGPFDGAACTAHDQTCTEQYCVCATRPNGDLQWQCHYPTFVSDMTAIPVDMSSPEDLLSAPSD